jgi:hypothetical protein
MANEEAIWNQLQVTWAWSYISSKLNHNASFKLHNLNVTNKVHTSIVGYIQLFARYLSRILHVATMWVDNISCQITVLVFMTTWDYATLHYLKDEISAYGCIFTFDFWG